VDLVVKRKAGAGQATPPRCGQRARALGQDSPAMRSILIGLVQLYGGS